MKNDIFKKRPFQVHERVALEYQTARLRYEHVQSFIVEHLRKQPSLNQK